MKNLLQFYRHCRAGGFEAGRRFWSERGCNHLHVLATSPPVVYLWWGRDDEQLHHSLKELPLIVLYLFPWRLRMENVPEVASQVRQTLQRYSRHRVVFLCNEEETVAPLLEAGMEALFVNQNAFINENVFRHLPGAIKTQDAVYSASMASYKRHDLARNVTSLMMLAYTYYRGGAADAYQLEVKQRLAHAWWPKDGLKNGDKVPAEQMVDWYNQARVGLCLSAEEGAMFASMEYMMCGLPVVSTKSKGGRDVFWDDRYVVLCEANPEAVAEAVELLKNRQISGDEIRRLTLEKVEVHRRRLREFLAKDGVDFECPWPPGSHGITTFSNLRQTAQAIHRSQVNIFRPAL